MYEQYNEEYNDSLEELQEDIYIAYDQVYYEQYNEEYNDSLEELQEDIYIAYDQVYYEQYNEGYNDSLEELQEDIYIAYDQVYYEQYNEGYNDSLEELQEYCEEQYINKKSIYFNQTYKRYNKRKKLEDKYIYMLEIYNGLNNIIVCLDDSVNYYSYYSDYIDSVKEIIDDLIERLTKEIDQENIYNINSESGLELLEELNILNDDLICINTEDEFPDIEIILLCKQKAKSIIKDFIDAKDNKYRSNKAKKYIEIKEREIKQKKEKNPNYLSLIERQNLMNKLKENGFSNSEIAERVNISRQAVWKHFNKDK